MFKNYHLQILKTKLLQSFSYFFSYYFLIQIIKQQGFIMIVNMYSYITK